MKQTSTERSRARRKRLKAKGLSEVRGINAQLEDHKAVKAGANKLIKELNNEG